ncbi:UNVERIFIED_CONTAM: Retrovirus-related Pol polyprotein from transposon TNT 1-94 [Sesamum radiatum]|uniref:Retrovirus-related Pol polyprotein from transposon TNT 1-94 n=1 Tax=Sesamum radiatum TaxID=300843 RepID=A0AAW2WHU1_SESRA
MQGKTLTVIVYMLRVIRIVGRKLENEGSGKQNFRSKSRGRKTIHCYKCKESGHMKTDCPKLKKQVDEKCDDSSKSANVMQNDNSDCSDGDMLSVSTNQYVDAWTLDSGCSYHITLNKEKVCVYFLKQKSKVFAKFKLWKAEVETQTGRKIKYLRSDNGTEYTDSQSQKFCEEHRIQRHFSVRKTPQQNGVAERMNMSLTEMARCLRLNAGLPKSCWAEAVSMTCYLINRSLRASLGGKIAEEQHQDKMPQIGSSSNTLQMELEPHPIATANHGSTHPTSGDPVAIESGGNSHLTSGGSTTNELQAYNLARDRQRRTNVKLPSRLGYEDMVSFALLISGDEPTTFHGAITSQEKKEWMGAMVEEMESLQKNHTWELVQLFEGKKAIGCKWVYRKKPAVSENEGEKFKARLAVLALVASWDLHLEQMDVKTTFLHGDLEEQIYMEQPDRFTQPGHEHLIGYKWYEYDCCVYVKSLDDGFSIFLLLYVDDMLIAAKNIHDVLALKALLSQEFDMKDSGAATKILGMEIHRDRGSKKLWLSQRGYVEKVLDRFGMSKAKPVSTPLANHFKLSSEQYPKTDREIEDMAKVPYASVVGCLMYAMVCTRPDLAHAISQVCKYMSKPGRHHWEAVKWIFRYLKGTVGRGVVFGSQQNDHLAVGYVDSDYAGDLDDRRSTSGYVFTLGGGIICWKSTVQSIVALFTTEAEYMTVAEADKEVLWFNGLSRFE